MFSLMHHLIGDGFFAQCLFEHIEHSRRLGAVIDRVVVPVSGNDNSSR